MLMSSNKDVKSFALGSAHEKSDVSPRPNTCFLLSIIIIIIACLRLCIILPITGESPSSERLKDNRFNEAGFRSKSQQQFIIL